MYYEEIKGIGVRINISMYGGAYDIEISRGNCEFEFFLNQSDMDAIHELSAMFASKKAKEKDEVESKSGLSFREAWFQLLNGKKIKLPSWEGYWIWENNTIMMHCKDGKILDIRETDNPAFTFSNVASDKWQVVE